MAKKSSPPRTESEGTNWRELYRAAILELDPSKLSVQIAEAESALIKRERELVQETGDNKKEEEQALDDAMYFLRVLSRMLKREPAAVSAIGETGYAKVA